jgi:hypothetical protein
MKRVRLGDKLAHIARYLVPTSSPFRRGSEERSSLRVGSDAESRKHMISVPNRRRTDTDLPSGIPDRREALLGGEGAHCACIDDLSNDLVNQEIRLIESYMKALERSLDMLRGTGLRVGSDNSFLRTAFLGGHSTHVALV